MTNWRRAEMEKARWGSVIDGLGEKCCLCGEYIESWPMRIPFSESLGVGTLWCHQSCLPGHLLAWRTDVQSAPENGVHFIAYWPHMGRATIAWRSKQKRIDWVAAFRHGDLGSIDTPPTHWMPLPAPPTPPEEKEE